MPLLESFLISIGATIAKYLLKEYLGKGIASEIAGVGVDTLKGEVSRILSRPSGGKQVDEIAAKVAKKLHGVLESEARLSKDDRERLTVEVATTLETARITPDVLVGYNLESGRLLAHLQNARPDATKLLSADDTALCQRLLREANNEILKVSTELAGFERAFAATMLKDTDRLLDLLTQSLKRPDEQAEKFLKKYREAVNAKWDRLETCGLPSVEQFSKRQQLIQTYITLKVEVPVEVKREEEMMRSVVGRDELREGAREDGKDEVRMGRRSFSIDGVLARSRRIVIRCGAGSGKTTLSRWIAVRSANATFESPLEGWNNTTPFLIPLRECVKEGIGFPAPEDFLKYGAPNVSGMMPVGWVHEQLESGQAVVLVDGVDELPREQRETMLEKLMELVKLYPASRYLITSRPAAVKGEEWQTWGEWIAHENFDDALLQAMNPRQVESFIDHWHDALAKSVMDEEEKKAIQESPDGLKRLLRGRPQLRQLAATPLLCAMICALFRGRGQNLPAARIKLYSECVEMLLSRREEGRKLALGEYPSMTDEQKLSLAKDFSYWLMRNGYSDVEMMEAASRFEAQLPSLNLKATGESVRRWFVERSALLREPMMGRVDFAHRTFQEFLAAQAVWDEGDMGVLLDRAGDDQWHEMIVLAAGLAPRKERERLLKSLIEKGDKLNDKQTRKRLYLLALACLETVVELDPATRQLVLDRASTIMPPQNDDLELIAKAGEPAVALLSNRPEYQTAEAIRCIQALAKIGTTSAMEAIRGYAKRNSTFDFDLEEIWAGDPEAVNYANSVIEVQEAIGSAWNNFDKTIYSDHVLSQSTVADFSKIQIDNLIDFKRLKQLRWLSLYAVPITDVSALTELENLQVLVLTANPVKCNIDQLSRLKKLRWLFLNESQISDIGGLAALENLEVLVLDNTSVGDVSVLKRLTKLRQLGLINTSVSDVSGLRDLPNLKILNLDNTSVSDVSALKGLTSLEELNLIGTLVTDVSPLKDLPSLMRLRLGDTQVSDVSALKGLLNLLVLRLDNTPVSDVSTLKDLRGLEALNFGGTQVSDVSALKDFPNLQELYFNNTHVDDLSALKDLPRLRTLRLDNTPVSDVSALNNLKSLEELNLGDTQVSDVGALRNLLNLREVYLDNTQVNDVSALKNLPNLKTLSLANTQVSDVSALKNLPNLKILFLDNTQVNDVSALEGKKDLRIVGVKKRKD
ncbi:MAG: leucine-rich repeat domain-containing protein [Chloroflexi bacterium]|nr:leucine-rich repeat domain-containing protein [Chloroflexota bacterium]